MPTRPHRLGVGLAAVMLATAGLSVVTTSPASAAVACGPSAPDRDPGTAQVINPDPAFPTGVALRTGPSQNCGLIVRVPWGAWVNLNCYRLGDSAGGFSTWSAVRYAQYFGWISDSKLSGGGTNRACVS